MNELEIQRFTNAINKQEGRKYPTSNQVVVCGFVGYEDEWNKFIYNNKENIKKIRKNDILFNNDEHWHYIKINSYFRGYRFYKLIVNHSIDRNYFQEVIYPCCSLYCCNIKWF